MAANEYKSFEDALDRLEVADDELKRLISAGEIRAMREGSRTLLRAEDVNRVADLLGTGPAVDETASGELLDVEEVSFATEDLPDLEEDVDAGMLTTQLSEEDTLLDDGLEIVEVEEEWDEPAKPARARADRAARSGGRAVAVAGVEGAQESSGQLFAAVATTAIMLWGISFALGMLSGNSTGITNGVVNMFRDS